MARARVVLAVSCLSLLGAVGAQAQISGSVWYNVIGKTSNKCVDAAAAGIANGTVVQQYACNGTTAQQWQFQATSGGYYRVNTRNAVTQSWDVAGVSTVDGGKIHLWAYGGGNTQQWLPVAEAGIKIVPDHADEAVTGAREAGEHAAESFVGRTGTIDVRSHESADSVLISAPDQFGEVGLFQGRAEIHKAAAVPGTESSAGQIHVWRKFIAMVVSSRRRLPTHITTGNSDFG